jgi:hypothetical protein
MSESHCSEESAKTSCSSSEPESHLDAGTAPQAAALPAPTRMGKTQTMVSTFSQMVRMLLFKQNDACCERLAHACWLNQNLTAESTAVRPAVPCADRTGKDKDQERSWERSRHRHAGRRAVASRGWWHCCTCAWLRGSNAVKAAAALTGMVRCSTSVVSSHMALVHVHVYVCLWPCLSCSAP